MAPSSSAAGASGVVDSLSHPLQFPPFSVDWVDGSRLVVTGGGGASRTGVPNGVWLYLVRGVFGMAEEQGTGGQPGSVLTS